MGELFPLAAGFLLVMNLLCFCLMGIDKSLARKRKRRIRERTLFSCALFFGAFGSVMGMYAFHHKTQKNAFRFGMPALLGVQAAAVWFLFFG